MSTYRKEWDCCGSVTETDGFEPSQCPFCGPAARAEPDPSSLPPYYISGPYLDGSYAMCETATSRILHKETPIAACKHHDHNRCAEPSPRDPSTGGAA